MSMAIIVHNDTLENKKINIFIGSEIFLSLLKSLILRFSPFFVSNKFFKRFSNVIFSINNSFIIFHKLYLFLLFDNNQEKHRHLYEYQIIY